LQDFIAANIQIDGKEQQELLEELDVRARIEKLLIHIKNEEEISKIQQNILEKVNQKVSKNQREFFLRQEMNTIQMELGIKKDPKDDLIKKYHDKFKKLSPFMNDEAKEKVADDVGRLAGLDMMSPEFSLTRTYLDVVFALPWKEGKKQNLDIKAARKILDHDHYGMKDVKNRILEFLAVKDLKKDDKGAILCLVGAPGVGKTSVGTSIARALGREYFRFSVGGMRDEAEIKGHRRTYIGAIPGKIIKGLQTVKTNNPIFLIDEIDKMGESYQGDPASALLEVLDPEQNNHFRDNYLDLPFDLSHILFIATANSISTIPTPLLDRMELIEVSGYTSEEKVRIGKKYLVPKSLKKERAYRR
jgi:ATP-dependent Lon protease